MRAGRVADALLDRTVALGYGRPGLVVRRALPGWPADPAPGVLAGRHVAVTGASSGLGIATAAGLARLGAITHLIVRDVARGEAAAEQVRQAVPSAELRVWRCDVGDLDDVRRFAGEFAAECARGLAGTEPGAAGSTSLHALIHNAGVMPPRRTRSPQGFEQSMAVHVLGPVLMTELLAAPLRGGRVIFVSSGGMYAQALRADDPDYLTGDYAPTTAYARSKRMQVELLPLLADRWSVGGIHTSVMHPGWADTPGVQDSLPTFRKLTSRILRDDAEGADTTVWLAAVEPPPPSGRFWHDRAERPTHLLPRTRPTEAAREQAWSWLRKSLGLTTPE